MDEIISTTLGPDLVRRGRIWELDLSDLKIFRGLSILSQLLCDEILDAVENTPGDLSILYKINPNINPELAELRISHIQIYARAGILKEAYVFREEFQYHLRTVFGTIQRLSWAGVIHPEFFAHGPTGATSRALAFPFHLISENERIEYQFILERVESAGRPGDYFFRLSIESAEKANLNLKNIPHAVVDDLGKRKYMAGSTRIAESLTNSILISCHRGQSMYSEEYRTYSQTFEQLSKTDLGALEALNFYWDGAFSALVLRSKPIDILPHSKKLMLCLEDDTICGLLREGATIKVLLGRVDAYLDLSRRGRVLNVSFNGTRPRRGLDYYLVRMPELCALARRRGHGLDFKGINIFLVHHITSEVLALIEALFELSSERIWVAFVKYAGKIPPDYLDVLLDVPAERLYMASLERKKTGRHIDYYSVSQAFSDTRGLETLHELMERETPDYFSAMRLLAGHLLLKFCLESERAGKRVLVIEDGGYLAPFLNGYIAEEKTLPEVLARYHVDSNAHDEPFAQWARRVIIGSVEHTRNGYNRLMEVQQKFPISIPAYTIAVSEKKTREESREVARSILGAVESALYGQGITLSRRRIVIMGAAGNIGANLCHFLSARADASRNGNISRIDIAFNEGKPNHFRSLDELPDELLLSSDLFLGVIGDSILKKEIIERLLIEGKSDILVFASGSTKTVEFADLIRYLNELYTAERREVGGRPADYTAERIIDPQSGMDLGEKLTVRISLDGSWRTKVLYLLGDLSPVNFLYYGVPTEAMDEIISQLTRLSLGVADLHRRGMLPKTGLYAVDREVDEWGNPLQGR